MRCDITKAENRGTQIAPSDVCKIKYELEYEMPTSTKSKQQLANKIQELKYIDGLKSSYRKFKL